MKEQRNPNTKKKLNRFWKPVIEVGFIVFLFYSNLLMGEYTRSGLGLREGLIWAVENIFTITNFMIAIVLSVIGQLVFEYLRKRS